MIDDEAELIRRAQTGDREAFAAIYDRHRQAILTYTYFRVSDQAAAEDLAAEVFVRMVAGIRRYRHRGKPILAWLYTIARHLLADYYRRNRRGARLPLDERLVAGSGNPVAAVEGQLAADCLQRALRRLSEAQRQVIVAKFVEDRSNREVADLLDKTEGAVKSLQHRALAALRRAIEKEGCYEP